MSKKTISLLLLLAIVFSFGTAVWADRYDENYFVNPRGCETMEAGKTAARIQHKGAGDAAEVMFAYFDTLGDAFGNLFYPQQHDVITLYRSSDAKLVFPLTIPGQDFYLAIERGSGVSFTGSVAVKALGLTVAVSADCADEIGLDAAAFDVTHYLVVPTASGGTGSGSSVGDPTDDPADDPADDPTPSADAYFGQIVIDKATWFFGGKNLVISWVLPRPDGSSRAVPGLYVGCTDLDDNVNVLVGNPEAANSHSVTGGVELPVADSTSVAVGETEIPAESVGQNEGVNVDVTDGPDSTSVDVDPAPSQGQFPSFRYSGSQTAEQILDAINSIFGQFGPQG